MGTVGTVGSDGSGSCGGDGEGSGGTEGWGGGGSGGVSSGSDGLTGGATGAAGAPGRPPPGPGPGRTPGVPGVLPGPLVAAGPPGLGADSAGVAVGRRPRAAASEGSGGAVVAGRRCHGVPTGCERRIWRTVLTRPLGTSLSMAMATSTSIKTIARTGIRRWSGCVGALRGVKLTGSDRGSQESSSARISSLQNRCSRRRPCGIGC